MAFSMFVCDCCRFQQNHSAASVIAHIRKMTRERECVIAASPSKLKKDVSVESANLGAGVSLDKPAFLEIFHHFLDRSVAMDAEEKLRRDALLNILFTQLDVYVLEHSLCKMADIV